MPKRARKDALREKNRVYAKKHREIRKKKVQSLEKENARLLEENKSIKFKLTEAQARDKRCTDILKVLEHTGISNELDARSAIPLLYEELQKIRETISSASMKLNYLHMLCKEKLSDSESDEEMPRNDDEANEYKISDYNIGRLIPLILPTNF